ncbi:MAG: choice-of-anchor B family protein, partial [Planctomycetota bacterium]
MTSLKPAAALVLLTAAAAAHEDDPKLLSRQPALQRPGWTAGALPVLEGQAALATLGQSAAPAGIVAANGGFEADGVQLLSWLTLPEFGLGSASGNDCWGYTSPSGRKYALMGLSNGTAFVDITDPANPGLVGSFSGPSSLWRDVKTYQDHAYSVSEGGGGIQVFDLSQIDAGVVVERPSVFTGPDTSASHNVAIDTVSGFLYRCGGGDNGLRIYSLANPGAPQYVAEWADRYVHDAQIVTFTSGPNAGRQIAFACSGFNGGFGETAVDVLDVTDKNAIQVLSRESWPSAAYSHQAWLDDDGRYLYVNDELDENGSINTRTIVLDVSNLNNAQYVTSFSADNPAVGHNLYVDGDLLYEANYRSGLRVFDIGANPLSPPEVAFFDTYPEDDDAEFNSLWSVYPYFDDQIVIGSDIERGLFVWYVGDPQVSFDVVNGAPSLVDAAGGSFEVDVTEAQPGDLVPESLRLVYDFGQGPISAPLSALGNGRYEASFGALPCGATLEYYLTAQSASGLVWSAPDLGVDGPFRAGVGAGETSVASFDMESTAGWVGGVAGDTASTGVWTRVDPIGTDAQPETDNPSGAGTRAWVTGQGSFGGSLGENDVDDGFTTLLSPVLDLAGQPGARVRFACWYDNGGNSAKDDVFDVDISNDGGQSWVEVERLGPFGPGTDGGWVERAFSIGEFVAPTGQVRLRFRARDEGDGSIVEAAIDDVVVTVLDCPDCNGNGIADGLDVLAGAADVDGNFVPDGCSPLVGAPTSLSLSAG